MKFTILAFVGILAMAGVPKDNTPDVKPPVVAKSDRQKVIDKAMTQVGIVEKTGKNDGDVEKYIASVGLNPKGGYPYCAAYNYWVGKEALGSKNPYPKSAWSPDHVKGGVSPTSTTIKGAETFGIYFNNLKRIGHTGLVKEKSGSYLVTVEANTSGNAAVGSAADRDGQGVFSKRRHINTVRLVKDWIKD